MKLYEIVAELRGIDYLIEQMDGELPPDLEATLDSLEMQFSEKVENLVTWRLEHLAKAEAFKREEDRFREKRTKHEKAAERIEQYVQAAMEQRNLVRVDTGRFVARIHQNGGKPKIWWAGHEAEPVEFTDTITITKPNHDKIQAAYKAGTLPAGYQVERGTHLRIK